MPLPIATATVAAAEQQVFRRHRESTTAAVVAAAEQWVCRRHRTAAATAVAATAAAIAAAIAGCRY